MQIVRDEARKIVDQLPDDATWEELAYRIYARQKIEAGLQEADEGLLMDQDEVESEMGFQP